MTFLNGVRRRRLIAKETSIANCEVLDEKHRIAVHRRFVGIVIRAGGAGVKVTDLLFAFAFFLLSSLVGCFRFINLTSQQTNRCFSKFERA